MKVAAFTSAPGATVGIAGCTVVSVLYVVVIIQSPRLDITPTAAVGQREAMPAMYSSLALCSQTPLD